MAANSSFRRCSVTLISLRPLMGSKARSTLAISLRSYSQSRHALACRACRQATLAPRPTELAGPLVEAHYGSVRIVGFLVEVQDHFHPPHELLGVVLGWDHPLLDQMRLEFVFLSVLPTSHARPSPRCPAPLLCPPAASKTSDCALVEVRSRPQGDQVRFGTPLQRTLVEP